MKVFIAYGAKNGLIVPSASRTFSTSRSRTVSAPSNSNFTEDTLRVLRGVVHIAHQSAQSGDPSDRSTIRYQNDRRDDNVISKKTEHFDLEQLKKAKLEIEKQIKAEEEIHQKQQIELELRRREEEKQRLLREKENEEKLAKQRELDAAYKQQITQQLHKDSRQRSVPTSQLGRLWHFGGLAAGLGVGTLSNMIKRTFTGSEGSSMPAILSEANVQRLVKTLSRMRGAALKLGQMLSIQDDALLPPQLAAILERVRYGADAMPDHQLEQMLAAELGTSWRDNFSEFGMTPIAAASIGQVHKAVLKDNREVAVKVQYPGVADSIESDVNNLVSLLNLTGLVPKGLYIEKSIAAAKEELTWETDYRREAANQIKFKQLLSNEPDFLVPAVHENLSSKRVFTSDFVYGVPVNNVKDMDQETRNWVAERLLKLCLLELFEFQFMQTDPNWSNFFYNAREKKIILLDFGACREFDRSFTDEYIRIVSGAAKKDSQTVLEASRKLGFLTGEESKIMNDAHVEAVMVVGEPFSRDGLYDFQAQNMTARIHALIPIMVKHRLTPPPIESYSLHRKLAGAFLICTRLGAVINSKKLFEDIHSRYYKNR
eukprot:TRINITY_DN26564_c0_g1_i1.p1 TRINITY_DN26564_c0_g1~~TRINITY_DN26564_c0_g1_i1.p1  ORF type:complete len:599 (-),score=100.77 TRINITY_DN26564_c0_g1_i1:9-1805(-)